MKCPECGSEIMDDAKFCPNCGVELDKVATVEMDPDATGILGTPVALQPDRDTQDTPAAGFEPVSDTAPTVPAQPAFTVPPQMPPANVCPSCGAPVADGDAFCGNCGMRLGAPAASPSYQSTPPAPAPQVMSASRPISSQELEGRYNTANNAAANAGGGGDNGGASGSGNTTSHALIAVIGVLAALLVVFVLVFAKIIPTSFNNAQTASTATPATQTQQQNSSTSSGTQNTSTSTQQGSSSSSSSNPYLSYSAAYIFPDSSSRVLSSSEISSLNEVSARLARNEIAARHGRIFKDSELREYFNSKSWYHGTVDPDYFDANTDRYYNSAEKTNLDKIIKLEEARNYNGK